MTALLEAPTRQQVVSFRPDRVGFFLDDDATSEVVRYFGKIVCPDCGRPVEVGATPGEPEIGHCCNFDNRRQQWCGARYQVEVQSIPAHMRMDDSRPRYALSGHGCVCGDPLCRAWEE